MKGEKKKILWIGAIGVALIAVAVIAILLLVPHGGDGYFALSPNELTLEVGDTELLQVVAKTDSGNILKPKWSSSAPSVVSVDGNGTITALAGGKAKITAFLTVGGKEYTTAARITVIDESQSQANVNGGEPPALERPFILSQKSDNVSDFPNQGKILVSDSASNSYMIFAAGKGTGLYAQSWELSGTMTKEVLDVPLFPSFGVIDENGKEQWFCILDDCLSLQRYWDWWETQYECDGDHVIRNQTAEDFFYRRRLDLSFKIVVKDDVLRAYFGESLDTLRLTWELPLTDATFGGFASGSSYQLAINTVDPNNLTISNVKTVVGDAVEVPSGWMPGAGRITCDQNTGVYQIPGFDDYVKDGYCYTMVSEAASRRFEIVADMTTDTDAWDENQSATGMGFVLKQGANTVLFVYENTWNIHPMINGVRDGAVDIYEYNCSYRSEVEDNNYVLNANVFARANEPVRLKLVYDDGKLWFFASYDGATWLQLNGAAYTIELLNKNGRVRFDTNQGFAVGIGNYVGESDGKKVAGGKIANVIYSTLKEVDPIVYDTAAGSYTMNGTAAGAVNGQYYNLFAKSDSDLFEVEADMVADTDGYTADSSRTGLGFVLRQGSNVVSFVYSKTWDIYPVVNGVSLLYENACVYNSNGTLGADVLTKADTKVRLKLAYDKGNIWFFKSYDNGESWTQINTIAYTIDQLNASGFAKFDASGSFEVGVGNFIGRAEVLLTGGGTVSETTYKGLTRLEPVVYDAETGVYTLRGAAEGIYNGQYYQIVSEEPSDYFEINATMTASLNGYNTDESKAGLSFVLKQGDNAVSFVYAKTWDIYPVVNGAAVPYENACVYENNGTTGANVLTVANTLVQLKMVYDKGEIWFYRYLENEVRWSSLNYYAYTIDQLNGAGFAQFDKTKGFSVGIGNFIGTAAVQLSSGGTISDVTVSEPAFTGRIWSRYAADRGQAHGDAYEAAATAGQTTMFIGDSFFDQAQFWPGFNRDLPNKDAVLLGIGGSRADDWTNYIKEGLFRLDIQPKNIVINIGNNDIYGGSTDVLCAASVAELVELLHEKAPNAKIYLYSITPRAGNEDGKASTLRSNEITKKWCEGKSYVTFLDISEDMTEDKLKDGIHPQERYYKEIFLPALKEAGCEITDKTDPIISYDEQTGVYTIPGSEGGFGTYYQIISPSAEKQFELIADFTPEAGAYSADAGQSGLGFVLKQGDNVVHFVYENTWNIHPMINGVRHSHIYNFNVSYTSDENRINNRTENANVFKNAGETVKLKLLYVDGRMWFSVSRDGGQTWLRLNPAAYSIDQLNENGVVAFDANAGFEIGIGNYIGWSDQYKIGGGTASGISYTDDPEIPIDGILHDAAAGTYTVDLLDGFDYALTQDTVSKSFTISADMTADSGSGIGFVLEQNGKTILFVYESQWDIHTVVDGAYTGGCQTDSCICHRDDGWNVGAGAGGSADVFANGGTVSLSLVYDNGNITLYHGINKINSEPWPLSNIAGFDISQPVKAGIGGFTGNVRTEKVGKGTVANVQHREVEYVEQVLPETSATMVYDRTLGIYADTDGTDTYSYAVTAEAAANFSLEATMTDNGQYPIMGFAVKQGDKTILFSLSPNADWGNENYINVNLAGADFAWNNQIPISQPLSFDDTHSTLLSHTMRMDYVDGCFWFYLKDGEGYVKLNRTPYTFDDLNMLCGGGLNEDIGFQAGVGADDGFGGTFTQLVYAKNAATVSEPIIYDAQTGTYSVDIPDGFAYTLTQDAQSDSFVISADMTADGESGIGFVLEQDGKTILFVYESQWDIHTVVDGEYTVGCQTDSCICHQDSGWNVGAGAGSTADVFENGGTVSLSLAYSNGNITLYNGGVKINSQPWPLSNIAGFDVTKPVKAGIGGITGNVRSDKYGVGKISNVKYDSAISCTDGTYTVDIPDGFAYMLTQKTASVDFEISADMTAENSSGIGFVLEQNGKTILFVYESGQDIHTVVDGAYTLGCQTNTCICHQENGWNVGAGAGSSADVFASGGTVRLSLVYENGNITLYNGTEKINSQPWPLANIAGFDVTQPVKAGIGGFTGNVGSDKVGVGTVSKVVYVNNMPATQYSISYVLNGGTNASDAPDSYIDLIAEDVKLPVPTRAGYAFCGWYDAAQNGNPIQSLSGMTGNLTLYAYWEELRSIKILAVGNSFSDDAMEHLYGILADGGYNDIYLGRLFIGGCSIDTHWNNLQTGQKAYTYYTNSTGVWRVRSNVSSITALQEQDWDIITVQQASPDSGLWSTYGNLENLLAGIRSYCPDAKVYWHMTWAYQQDSTHDGFANYDKDQMTMYQSIISTVKDHVAGIDGIAGVIPSGTAIQNLRTTYLGDTLTRDGYHMSMDVGRYTVALCWYAKLTGGSVEDIDWLPESYADAIEPHRDAIRGAVAAAIEKPYQITQLNDVEPSGVPQVLTELSGITYDYAEGAYIDSDGSGSYSYAVTDTAATGFTLEATMTDNGKYPMMGFAVKQGSAVALFSFAPNSGYGNQNYINVNLASDTFAWKNQIPISTPVSFDESHGTLISHTLKMEYENGNFWFYLKQGEQWTKLNQSPYTFYDLNTLCGGLSSTSGFQVGVGTDDGFGGTFTDIAYTATGGGVIEPPKPNSITVTMYETEGKLSYGYTWNSTVEPEEPVIAIKKTGQTDWSHYPAEVSQDPTGVYVCKAVAQLEPGTEYTCKAMELGSGVQSSEYTFVTVDPSDESFTFAAFGDTQNVAEDGRLWNELLRETSDADFYVHTGDICQDANSESHWYNMLHTNAEYLATKPIMVAAGNHDTLLSARDDTIYSHFNNNIPEQTTKEGYYYSYTYGNAKFIVLNSNDLTADNGLSQQQYNWLVSELESNDKAWTIVTMHNSLYSAGSHSQDASTLGLRAQLSDLFAQYGVDLVIAGHDHVISKTYPIGQGQQTDTTSAQTIGSVSYEVSPEGTVYIVNGPGGDQSRYPGSVEEEYFADYQRGGAQTWTECSVYPDRIVIYVKCLLNGEVTTCASWGILKSAASAADQVEYTQTVQIDGIPDIVETKYALSGDEVALPEMYEHEGAWYLLDTSASGNVLSGTVTASGTKVALLGTYKATVGYDAATQTYTMLGASDGLTEGLYYKLISQQAAQKFEIVAQVTPELGSAESDADSGQTGIGFTLKQGENTVHFVYQNTWNIHPMVNGVRQSNVYDFNVSYSSKDTRINNMTTGGHVYKTAGQPVWIKLSYDNGTLWFYNSTDGVNWTKAHEVAYTLDQLNINGTVTFDAAAGFEVGIGNWLGTSDTGMVGGGTVSQVAYAENGTVTPEPVEQTLTVLDGVTYNGNTGIYTTAGSTGMLPYAVTEEAYSSVELQAVFHDVNKANGVYPVMGFVVKQGDNVASLYFSAGHYYENSICVDTAATGYWHERIALNQPVYFSTNNDGTKTLKMVYIDGGFYFYLLSGDAWTLLNDTPYTVAQMNTDLGTSFDAGIGIQVGIGGKEQHGGLFSKVAVSQVQAVSKVLTELSDSFTYDSALDAYTDANSSDGYSYAVTGTASTGFTLEATMTDNGQYPMMGFAVKQGSAVALFSFAPNSDYGNQHYINVNLASDTFAWKNQIPISTPVSFDESHGTLISHTLKMEYENGNFWFYLKQGEQWTKLNQTAFTFAALNTLCGGGLREADGLQVGVGTDDGFGGTFTEVVYTGSGEELAPQGSITEQDGTYSIDIPSGFEYVLTQETASKSFTISADMTANSNSGIGFVLEQNGKTILFTYEAQWDIHTVVDGAYTRGCQKNTCICHQNDGWNVGAYDGASADVFANGGTQSLSLVYDNGNITLYHGNAKINSKPWPLSNIAGFDVTQPVKAGIGGFTGNVRADKVGAGTVSNVQFNQPEKLLTLVRTGNTDAILPEKSKLFTEIVNFPDNAA